MFSGDKRKKPAPWAFDKGLVDPKWNRFWSKIIYASPVWPSGNTIRDVVTGNSFTFTGTVPTQSVRELGQTLSFVDGTTSEQAITNFPQLGVVTALTVLCVWAPQITAGNNQNFMNVQQGTTFKGWRLQGQNQANNTIKFSISDGTLAVLAVSDRVDLLMDRSESFAVAFTSLNNSLHRLYIDGVQQGADDTTTMDFSAIDIDRLTFGRSQSAGGDLSAVFISDQGFSPAEIKQWSADPFGPFRMAERAIGFVPSVVSIPTIHLTMPPYIPA